MSERENAPSDLASAIDGWKRLPVAKAAEAARADQEARWRRGEPVPVERYLDGLPHVKASIDDALVLVYGEVLQRVERGETANLLDYQRRFPSYVSALTNLFELHDAMSDLAVEEPDPTPVGSMWISGSYSATVVESPPFAEEVVEIPGYRIEGILGQGGTSIVFRAEQLASNRLVALKVLRPTNLPESAVRFMQEADVLRRLKHPNIVELLDAGWSGPHLFIAMELVSGGSLDQMLDGKPQDPRRAAEIVMLVATGVEQAHRQGIIHRDLKPSNVLMSRAEPAESDGLQGVPKVADFGVARLHHCGGTLTATGEVIGTPSYMPPEQFEGRKQDIRFETDVYSLGAILYQLLTGRQPFQSRKILDLFRQIIHEPPPKPSGIVPGLDSKLEAICLQCLHKDPARRISSAEALADELRLCL